MTYLILFLIATLLRFVYSAPIFIGYLVYQRSHNPVEVAVITLPVFIVLKYFTVFGKRRE
jgi:hypothetical protein